MTEKPAETGKKTFDMYHFFSRKDMVLAGVVILALLVLGILLFIFKPQMA